MPLPLITEEKRYAKTRGVAAAAGGPPPASVVARFVVPGRMRPQTLPRLLTVRHCLSLSRPRSSGLAAGLSAANAASDTPPVPGTRSQCRKRWSWRLPARATRSPGNDMTVAQWRRECEKSRLFQHCRISSRSLVSFASSVSPPAITSQQASPALSVATITIIRSPATR